MSGLKGEEGRAKGEEGRAKGEEGRQHNIFKRALGTFFIHNISIIIVEKIIYILFDNILIIYACKKYASFYVRLCMYDCQLVYKHTN